MEEHNVMYACLCQKHRYREKRPEEKSEKAKDYYQHNQEKKVEYNKHLTIKCVRPAT